MDPTFDSFNTLETHPKLRLREGRLWGRVPGDSGHGNLSSPPPHSDCHSSRSIRDISAHSCAPSRCPTLSSKRKRLKPEIRDSFFESPPSCYLWYLRPHRPGSDPPLRDPKPSQIASRLHHLSQGNRIQEGPNLPSAARSPGRVPSRFTP